MSLGTYKVVLLGEGRVGKTSIASRFVDDTFDSDQVSTVQANMYSKKRIPVEGTLDASRSGERSKGRKYVDIALWDTAGQERYHALGPIYYRNANGAVLVYDITDADTFERIRMWIKELRQVVGDNIHIVICGNKSDLESEREVNLAMAEKFARSQGAAHFSTSAKTNEGVAEAFQCLVQKILESLGLLSADANGEDGEDGGGEDDENMEDGDEFPTRGAGSKKTGGNSNSKSKKTNSSPTTRRAGVKIALDDDHGEDEAVHNEDEEEKADASKTSRSGKTSSSSASKNKATTGSGKKGAAAKIAEDNNATDEGTHSRAAGYGYDDYGGYGSYVSSSTGAAGGGRSNAEGEEDNEGKDEAFISGGGGGGGGKGNSKNSNTKPAPPSSASKRTTEADTSQQKKGQPITLDDSNAKNNGNKKDKKKDKDCAC